MKTPSSYTAAPARQAKSTYRKASEPSREPYAHDLGFEKQVVRLLCTSAEFYAGLAEHIEDGAFKAPEARWLIAACRNVEDRCGRGPGSDDAVREMLGQMHADGGLSKDDQILATDYLMEAIDEGGTDEDVVRGLFTDGVKRRAEGKAIEDGLMKFGQRGDMSEVATKLQAANSIGQGKAPARPVALSTVSRRRTEWLVPRLIPKGRLVDVTAPGGSGKSTIVSDLVARLSTGGPLWDGSTCEPVRTLWVTSEEFPDEDILPRQAEIGTDLDMVEVIRAQDLGVDLRKPVEAARLLKLIEERGFGLVVIDPFQSVSGADDCKPHEVRAVLDRLSDIGEKTGCTIMNIRHWRKAGGSATDRAQGAKTFTDAARVAMVVVKDPKTDDVVLAVSKANKVPKGKAYRFRIVVVDEDDGLVKADLLHEDQVDIDALCDPKALKPLDPMDVAIDAALPLGADEVDGEAIYERVAETLGDDAGRDSLQRRVRDRLKKVGAVMRKQGPPTPERPNDRRGRVSWSRPASA